MFFDSVTNGREDVMYQVKAACDSDHDPSKIDLGVGTYRNEDGDYHELNVLKEAKKKLYLDNPGHDYEVTVGNASFLENAAKVVFGKESALLKAGKIATVQTISGTGAIHTGALFLTRSATDGLPHVYVGTPTWGNYQPLLSLAGLDVRTYNHYLSQTGTVDFESVLSAIRTAPRGSTLILQGCCHNPTAADFSREQWDIVVGELKSHGHLPFFDIAYQGLGQGVDEDVYGVRMCAEEGMEMIVCQSFAKNFGLYGERCGALHVACTSRDVAARVKDQLRCLIRWEFSSSPAYGARLVNLVLSDRRAEEQWRQELGPMRERLRQNRKQLYTLLTDVYKTPGDWSPITRGSGLFSLLPMTKTQCQELQNEFHIYAVPNGRVTISGLSQRNIDYAARAIDAVVRSGLESPEPAS